MPPTSKHTRRPAGSESHPAHSPARGRKRARQGGGRGLPQPPRTSSRPVIQTRLCAHRNCRGLFGVEHPRCAAPCMTSPVAAAVCGRRRTGLGGGSLFSFLFFFCRAAQVVDSVWPFIPPCPCAARKSTWKSRRALGADRRDIESDLSVRRAHRRERSEDWWTVAWRLARLYWPWFPSALLSQ